jgi:ribonuclease BN (tRNA processing enzyme)
MKLTCLGKYGPFPKAGCACSSYLLEREEKNIVIDLGCGGLTRLLQRLDVKDIGAVVLSHLHADHMGDILTLRYALDAVKKLGQREDPLPVYMPAEPSAEAGLIASCKMIAPVYINDNARHGIFGIDVRFALMTHSVPSYAMAFNSGGKKFVYSGDTRYDENLIPFAMGADLLLMEAAFFSSELTETAMHVSAEEAGLTGKKAGVKRLLLTHIFPPNDEGSLLSEAKSNYPGAEIIEELKTYEV